VVEVTLKKEIDTEIKCPGFKDAARPNLELMPCPHCGGEVEIFTDEEEVTCDGCGKVVKRERGASCADWCRYAKDCFGRREEGVRPNLPPALL